MLHLHKQEGQPWVDRHVESMRLARGWVVATEGAPCPHCILAQCAATWIRWSEYDPGTLLGRAVRWQNARYNQDTAYLYRAVSAPRHLATRNRIGRPLDRWEKRCVKTWGISWYESRAKCPTHIVKALS